MSSDNRRFLRVPAYDAHPQAIVRLEGNRTLSCEVLNKSTGGYGIGVTADSAPAFPPGRILLIEVDDLLVQVKVAHAAPDPEDDRYLIGLERIAELEDKLAAQQPHASWLSALWPTPQQGLGGQSSGLRDLVLATMFCSSLLLFTWLPTLMDTKGSKKSRGTSSNMSFSVPWSWPSLRTSAPKVQPATNSESGSAQPAARTVNSATRGTGAPVPSAGTPTAAPGANAK